jgi:hypothetical protein
MLYVYKAINIYSEATSIYAAKYTYYLFLNKVQAKLILTQCCHELVQSLQEDPDDPAPQSNALGEGEVSQWNVLQFNTGTTAPFIIKCGANSSGELVIKADLRVQEPKGGEVIRVVPRPTVLADLSFEEIKGVFEQLPEAVSLLALARTADGTRARYSRLYRTLASKVTALKETVAEMERGGVFKDVR